MCGGGRRQHHRQQEQMRAETAQRNIFDQAQRDRQAELDRMTAMQQEADRRQQDALRMIADSSKQPFKLRTAAEAATPLLRTKSENSTSSTRCFFSSYWPHSRNQHWHGTRRN
jgi:hypothetical protein